MPVTLKLTFPAGRYHATPWGRHVNEGVAEWPPSPWRLLRALVATWKRTCPGLSDEAVHRVLGPLASAPKFHLPPSREAHTRHYVPWEKKGPADRTLIFDTFVAVGRHDPIFVHWPDVDLREDDRATLAQLVANLSTLGRAESWVLAESVAPPDVPWNCFFPQPDDAEEGCGKAIRVLCPDPASAFASDHYPTHDLKKLRKGLAASDLLFDCPPWHLCLDTETIHSRRWPNVPGARWMTYVRSVDASSPANADVRHRPSNQFTVARYLLDGPVLPPVIATLPLAERLRHELLRKCKRIADSSPAADPSQDRGFINFPVFSGKDDGQPLRDNRGAFFLPTDEDGDGRIDHVTIFAEAGLGDPDSFEVRAIDALRTLRFGDGELSLRLVGLGRRGDFARVAPLAPSRTWTSATPFLVTRHLKRRGRKRDPREWFDQPDGMDAFVRQVLREALERRGLTASEIETLPHVGHPPRRPLDFRLSRGKSGDDGDRRRRGLFRIRFPEPVEGPIAVGHSCHFGLGLFLPS